MTVRRRTSTAPGVRAAVPTGPRRGARRARPRRAGGVHELGEQLRSCRPTGRCGRSTRPTGCSVAARRSTSTVRSLAATAAVVTTAACRATSGASDAGIADEEGRLARAGAQAGMARVVGDDDEVGPGPRLDRGAGGAHAGRGPTRRGRAGRRRGRGPPARCLRRRRRWARRAARTGTTARRPLERGVAHPPGGAAVDGRRTARARRRTRRARENVTPDGETQMVRTRGAAAWCARTRPSRQLAASKAASAGHAAEALQQRGGVDRGLGETTAGRGRRRTGRGRRRPLERRARAAQAREPIPSATQLGQAVGRRARDGRRSVGWSSWWCAVVGQAQPPARPHAGRGRRSAGRRPCRGPG